MCHVKGKYIGKKQQKGLCQNTKYHGTKAGKIAAFFILFVLYRLLPAK